MIAKVRQRVMRGAIPNAPIVRSRPKAENITPRQQNSGEKRRMKMKILWHGTFLAAIVAVFTIGTLRYHQSYFECRSVIKVDYHNGGDFQSESDLHSKVSENADCRSALLSKYILLGAAFAGLVVIGLSGMVRQRSRIS
jgi:hypothetical protein